MTAAVLSAVLQQAVVGVAVLGCTAYAAWSLAPAALRRPLARLMLRQRWLAGSAALRAASRAPMAGGCACDGCDGSKAGRPAAPGLGAGQAIRIVPRSQMPR